MNNLAECIDKRGAYISFKLRNMYSKVCCPRAANAILVRNIQISEIVSQLLGADSPNVLLYTLYYQSVQPLALVS